MLQVILEKSRFILIIAVLGSLVAALMLLFLGASEIIGILVKTFSGLPELKSIALKLIEIVDVFLMATVFLIVAVGLYELFINPDVKVPAWLEINSLDDLKTKLVGTVIIVLGVLFLGNAASWKGDTEILNLGVAIAAVIVALTYFTSKRNSEMDYPVTPAVRVLRDNKINFEPHVFEYLEKGGTKHSAQVLGVDEHLVIKTLVFETDQKKPLVVLMHGDAQVSTRNLARFLRVKTITPVTPEKAYKLTGYLVGGTSPFGVKTRMPIYAESSIFDLPQIYLNGGKRGFLVEIRPTVLETVLEIKRVDVAVKSE